MSPRALIAAALVLTLCSPTIAGAVSPDPTPSTAIPTDFDGVRRVDANQANMWLSNVGSFAWDLTTGNAGFIYPRGSGRTAIFASGLWLAGQRGPQTLVTVAEYSQEYGPGWMIGGLPVYYYDPDVHTFKVVRWTGDPTDSAHVDRTLAELAADPQLDPLYHHSWSEYMAGAATHGAPWKIYQLPDPDTPDPLDTKPVPGPDVLGDEMLWAVYNDADASFHTNQAGSTAPMGVEVQQTTFAYASPPQLASTVFLKFRLINNGPSNLNQAFVSLWSDPDVGGFTDDLVGCDVGANLGYAYNATNADAIYGSSPPAVGYDIFRGPQGLGMYAFNKYVNGTDPASAAESYNYMTGLLPDGSPIIDPTTLLPTRYFVSGDPVAGTGWLDSNPGDRRMLLSSGPFTFAVGDTEEVIAGIIIGQGPDRLSSISSVRARDAYAQAFADAGFDHPVPALASLVSADAADGRVHLAWLASGGASVRVERREETSAWRDLGIAVSDASGLIEWTDADVRAGWRYGYRVASGDVFAGETWVSVPSALRLAIGRLTNPSVGSFAVSFTLPSASPASLEVFDVRGRRVFVREVGALGIGPHVLDLGGDMPRSPGLYFLRLTQGSEVAEARATFLR